MSRQKQTMKLKIALLFLLTLGTLSSFGQRTVNYLRTNDYNRLRISIDELKKIVSSIQYYFDETPKDSTDQFRIIAFKCDFSKKGKALSLSSFKQIAELNLDGESYNDIVLIYSWDTKPISEITFYLNCSYRKISISGTDEKKVEALFRDIDAQLKATETTLAWINWEMVFGIAATLLYVFLIPILAYAVVDLFTKKRNRKTTVVFLISGTYCIAAVIFFFSPFSFRDMLPGFLLSPNKTSWIDNNANLLGFIGFIFTIIPIIYKTTKWVWREHATEADKTSNENESKV